MDYHALIKARITGLYKDEIRIPKPCGIGDLNRMMQHATEHAMENLGISIEELKNAGLLWVITFTQIEISHMPKDGEDLILYTWPGAEKMGMFTRRYAAFTQSGEELFTAASLFSLVNEKKRTLVLPAECGYILPTVVLPEEPKLPKLTVRGEEGKQEVLHQVHTGEIDHNGHVNNACYLDWAEELLQTEKDPVKENIRSIWIAYSKEILEGETVQLRYRANEEELFLRGYVNRESCFTIRLLHV